MAEGTPGQGGQEEEVQDILSDLDNILQTLTESARVVEEAKSTIPVPAAKPPAPATKPPAPAAKPPAPAAKPPAPAAKPPAPATKPPAPAAKPPAPAPQAVPESAQDRGASAPPAPTAKPPAPAAKPPAPAAKPPVPAVKPPAPEPVQWEVRLTPAPAPQAAPESEQDQGASARPAPAPQATPESAQDRGASARPAMAPFGELAKTDRPEPSLPPSVVERVIVDIHPKPAPESTGGPGGAGIELAPRSGMLPASPKKAKPDAAEPPRRGLPTVGFVEVPAGGIVEPPKAEPEPPAPASPIELTLEPAPPEPLSAPKPAVPAPQAAPESAQDRGASAPPAHAPQAAPESAQDRGASAPPASPIELTLEPAPAETKLELKPAAPAAPMGLKMDLTPESALTPEQRQAVQDTVSGPPVPATQTIPGPAQEQGASMPPAAPVPVFSGPAAFTANPEPIPDKTPPDQIRRIAFLYSTEQREACDKFAKFIGQVAKTFGKKPIYVHQSARAEVRADVSPRELLDKLKAAGTVGILAILEGLPADKTQELEKVFEDEDIFFRVVPAAEISKRLSAIDHVVDMMLLKAG